MADDQRMCNRAITKYDDTDRQEHEKVNRRDRSRSRSPRRDNHNDRGRRKDKGFKWKVKRRDGDEPDSRDGGLRRGYRDHYRQRSRSRSRSRSPRRYSSKKHDEDDGVDKKKHKEKDSEQKSKKLAPVAPTPSQPMILVYVNDRLGTKKAIPCFVTDSISEYALHIRSGQSLTMR